MRQLIGEWLSSHQEKFGRRSPFHWGGGEIILAAILIFGILSLGSGMVGKWIDAAGDSRILPVSLHSLSEADYSVDEILRSVPAIGLDIIRDILGINKPPDTGGVPEIAVIIPGTPTSTPTANLEGFLPTAGTATSDVPVVPTATEFPPSTATSNPRPTASPTPQPAPTNSPPTATDTTILTVTPKKIATNTPLPTQKPPTVAPTLPPTSTSPPAPTFTPNPTPTPVPNNSPTPRPTRSSTLAVTPTAKYTPGVTGGSPVVP